LGCKTYPAQPLYYYYRMLYGSVVVHLNLKCVRSPIWGVRPTLPSHCITTIGCYMVVYCKISLDKEAYQDTVYPLGA